MGVSDAEECGGARRAFGCGERGGRAAAVVGIPGAGPRDRVDAEAEPAGGSDAEDAGCAAGGRVRRAGRPRDGGSRGPRGDPRDRRGCGGGTGGWVRRRGMRRCVAGVRVRRARRPRGGGGRDPRGRSTRPVWMRRRNRWAGQTPRKRDARRAFGCGERGDRAAAVVGVLGAIHETGVDAEAEPAGGSDAEEAGCAAGVRVRRAGRPRGGGGRDPRGRSARPVWMRRRNRWVGQTPRNAAVRGGRSGAASGATARRWSGALGAIHETGVDGDTEPVGGSDAEECGGAWRAFGCGERGDLAAEAVEVLGPVHIPVLRERRQADSGGGGVRSHRGEGARGSPRNPAEELRRGLWRKAGDGEPDQHEAAVRGRDDDRLGVREPEERGLDEGQGQERGVRAGRSRDAPRRPPRPRAPRVRASPRGRRAPGARPSSPEEPRQPVDKTPRMGIRPRRDGELHRPGGCGALSPQVAARIACAIRSALSRGEGGPSPHPSPAALRTASTFSTACRGRSPRRGGAPARGGRGPARTAARADRRSSPAGARRRPPARAAGSAGSSSGREPEPARRR